MLSERVDLRMLIQMPRGSPDQPGSNSTEARNAFEAALRRDLASTPVVSYDTVLGGWAKRAIDIFVVLTTAPLWAPLTLIVALVARLRLNEPVFFSDERIGYGGHAFRRFKLRIVAPAAEAGDEVESAWGEIAVQAEDARVKWLRALERLPQLFNVLRGDMALVGPSPLTRVQLESLKSAKRHYLSARPGVIGVTSILDGCEDASVQYKAYAMSWSLLADAVIAWDALSSLRYRGELWKPGRVKSDVGRTVIVRRRDGP